MKNLEKKPKSGGNPLKDKIDIINANFICDIKLLELNSLL